jgi:CheY-like chemotaxis protein/anti-sigma regulatory factor (Ser/Thr protein kinase)
MGVTPVVAGPPALRFLVADDDAINRVLLRALLEQAGHAVIEAGDGEQAVEAFARERPDAVLLDVMMPGLDGYEAARRIKALAGECFVPILFLTALGDEASLQRCIEAGGDDFLTKPFSRAILETRIRAALRIRDMAARLERQNADLRTHQARLAEEQRVAEQVFSRFVHHGCLRAPFIRYLASPVALFNGDLLLAARQPSGGLLVLIGDFAGHGLPAALGAMPVAEVFHAGAAAGYGIGELVAEINHRLKDRLPTGLFFAACLAEIDKDGRSLAVWNGGLPDVLVCGRDHPGPRRLVSRHPPLGVLPNERLDRRVERLGLGPDDRVYLYTDGITEARNAAGELFGSARLEMAVSAACCAGAFDLVRTALSAFRRDTDQQDDMTLIEIAPGRLPVTPFESDAREPRVYQPADWRVALEFDPQTLRQVDPLPVCLQLVMALQGLGEHRERLYVILAELVNNAIDHGLLRLDSTLKHRPGGFTEYYAARTAALAALTEGTLRIELVHTVHTRGGRLTLRVEDSGPGFDDAWLSAAGADAGESVLPSGRGLALVRTLASGLRRSGHGVEAVYEWC